VISVKKQPKISKNEQKTVVFDKKTMILRIFIAFGVAIAMVFIFGKLAPVAIVSFKLLSNTLSV
jgi:hypothetical protein